MKTFLRFRFSGIELNRIAATVALVVLASSCARSITLKSESEDEIPSNVERITLLGVNDLHGALLPSTVSAQTNASGSSVHYEKGGASLMASYFHAVRAKYGASVFALMVGDFLFGSYEAAQDKGSSTIRALNLLHIDAAVLGPHDFDWGTDILKARMAESQFPFVLSNFTDSADTSLASWPHAERRAILDNGRVKIGVLGLMSSHFRQVGRTFIPAELSVSDLVEATQREAHTLRQQGAQVIVLLAHAGLDCDPRRFRHASNGNLSAKTWRPATPQEACLRSGELVQVLEALPAGTVDAVVSGNGGKVVHNWVKGIPVVEGGWNGEYLHLLHLFYDPRQRKVRTDLTRIEGPYAVCASIFANQLDCNEKKPLPKTGRGDLLHASLFDHRISANEEMEKTLQPLVDQVAHSKKAPLAQAAHDIPDDSTSESALGNLVADSIRERLKTDFAFVNPGAMRAPLHAGPITEHDLFTSLPFELSLARLSISGYQLKRLLTILTSGSRGFPSVSGLRLHVIDLEYPGRPKDLDGDHHVQHWEIDRLLATRNSQGFQIKDFKKYTIATTDFLARGGDDLTWAISQLPASSIQLEPTISLRDTVAAHLRALGQINTDADPLVVASSPRLKRGIAPPKAVGRRRRAKKR